MLTLAGRGLTAMFRQAGVRERLIALTCPAALIFARGTSPPRVLAQTVSFPALQVLLVIRITAWGFKVTVRLRIVVADPGVYCWTVFARPRSTTKRRRPSDPGCLGLPPASTSFRPR
jgi:hypothetical protein